MVLTIGIDFDNTLANYSGVFYQVARALKWLPEHVGQSKAQVKQYFFDQEQQKRWTQLQGVVYGNEIYRAQLYQDAKEVLRALTAAGHTLYIISHKTQFPVIGEPVSLHDCASNWLVEQGVVGHEAEQLSREQVFFNQRQQDKVAKISALGCDYFIDDLPAIFQRADFPQGVKKIFFDPDKHHSTAFSGVSADSSADSSAKGSVKALAKGTVEKSFVDMYVHSWREVAEIFNV